MAKSRFKITLHGADPEKKSGRAKVGKSPVIQAEDAHAALAQASDMLGKIAKEQRAGIVRVLVELDDEPDVDGFGL